MLSRFSSLRFLAASVSKSAATRNTTPPAFNPLLHFQARRYVNGNNDMMPVPPACPGGRLRRSTLPPDAPRAAVILTGSNCFNGTDPLEAACLIILLARHGIKADFFAPNATLNYRWNFEMGGYLESRMHRRLRLNARSEAARLIPNHRIEEIRLLRATRYEALIIPGGAGSVLRLGDIYREGERSNVALHQHVIEIIKDFRDSQKPIGTISYSGLLLTKVFSQLNFTMGHEETSNSLLDWAIAGARNFGARHRNTATENVTVDARGCISTPGNTNERVSPTSVYNGIGLFVQTIRQIIDERRRS